MKKFLLLFLLLGVVQIMSAQKIAHVDMVEITTKMPKILEAQKQLKELGQTYQEKYKVMSGECQSKLEKYETEASKLSTKIKTERQKEIQDLNQKLQEFSQTAQKELQSKESELMSPISNSIKTAIQKVGIKKGFKYILDSNTLLLATGVDITSDVKKELGFD